MRPGGTLTLSGAKLSAPRGSALNLDRATMAELDAPRLVVSSGAVSLNSAQIATDVIVGATVRARWQQRAGLGRLLTWIGGVGEHAGVQIVCAGGSQQASYEPLGHPSGLLD